MALQACIECGERVSSHAQACPHCGHPVAITTDAQPKGLEEREQSQQSRKKDYIIRVALVMAAVIILVVIISAVRDVSPNESSANQPPQSPSQPAKPDDANPKPAPAASGAEGRSKHAAKSGGEPCVEFDIANILFKPQAAAVRYFGKPRKILPPNDPSDPVPEWEYDYSGENSTWGTKSLTLGLQYTFRKTPKDYDEALCRVGLSADGSPQTLIPNSPFIWGPHVETAGVVRFQGVALDHVIIPTDLTQISIWGEDAFASISR